MPSSLYDWGVAKWVYIAASVIAIAGAVWLLAVKVKEKRALKAVAFASIFVKQGNETILKGA